MFLTPGGEKKKKSGAIPEADCEQAFQYLGGRNKNEKVFNDEKSCDHYLKLFILVHT